VQIRKKSCCGSADYVQVHILHLHACTGRMRIHTSANADLQDEMQIGIVKLMEAWWWWWRVEKAG
jgi:hypothetical protein